jgi:hypothetical protein
MLSPPLGLATFPGIGQLIDASIHFTHGISPSVARLTVVPQSTPPAEAGTLAFHFGGTSLSFPDCKVDYGTLERTTSGEVFRLTILDRRWKWRFGQISGTYNVWGDDFTLRRGQHGAIDTQRTPQELAALCLEAMGETGFDVSDMPNDARPSVEWDHVVPAAALAALCDELGCRVVLGLDNRIAIRRVGAGALLPNHLPALAFSTTINPPEVPGALTVVGGAIRYQVDLPLEAVGLTGQIGEEGADALVPIDELSYRPAGGWSAIDLPYFHQVAIESRSLAAKSVLRYYRVKTPITVPGYEGPNGNQVERLEQILPLEDEQVEVAVENGQAANLPAAVFGVWFPETGDVANNCDELVPLEHAPPSSGTESVGLEYRGGYTLDTARGLVIFDEPVYRNDHESATGGAGYELVVAPAELVLRAACSVRDRQSLAVKRYSRERGMDSNLGAPARYLRHDEIVLTHRPTYSETYALVDVDTNAADADQMADAYLDAAQLEYQFEMPQTAHYVGLIPIELDGAIQQVSFQVGVTGTTTSVARNNDAPRLGRPHWHMRRVERQRAAEAIVAQLGTRSLARSLKNHPHSKPRPRL